MPTPRSAYHFRTASKGPGWGWAGDPRWFMGGGSEHWPFGGSYSSHFDNLLPLSPLTASTRDPTHPPAHLPTLLPLFPSPPPPRKPATDHPILASRRREPFPSRRPIPFARARSSPNNRFDGPPMPRSTPHPPHICALPPPTVPHPVVDPPVPSPQIINHPPTEPEKHDTAPPKHPPIRPRAPLHHPDRLP